MAKTITFLTSNSVNNIDTNFQRVNTALQDVLSLSGELPNSMTSDFDMNSNDILNVNTLQANDITIDGSDATGILQRALDAAEDAEGFAEDSESSAIDSAASAASAAASAAGVNLPTIISGDAGKQLYVNTAEDGYVLDEVSNTEFTSLSLAEAYSPISAPDSIRTAGYTTAGDHGGGLYKKVGSEPSHAGKFSITLDDGVTVVWYELAEDVVTPFMLGAVGDGSDEGALLQSTIDIGRAVDLAGGNFVTHQQLLLATYGQKIFNSQYIRTAGSVSAGAAIASVFRIDAQWVEVENIAIQGSDDEGVTKYATNCVIYYNGGRATLRKCDLLWAISDGVYFDLEADTPDGNNNLARVIQCDIRLNGRDGINIPRKGPAEGDQNGITITYCNIRQNQRHGIYTNAMGTFIDFCHIESNAQGGTGWGIYVEPFTNGAVQVIPAIGPHNWLENGGDGDIYGWGEMQWAQTGAVEARTINAAPIKGNVSRNVTFRHAQDGGTSISADGYFCDIWRVISNGATFSLNRVNPDASLGRTKFGGAPYVAELNITSFGSGSFVIGQAIPDVSTLAGQGITVSFNAQSPAGDLCFIRVEQNFGAGGSATVITDRNLILSNISAGGGRLPTYANLIIPPIDGKTIGTNSFLNISLHIANTKSTGVYRFSGFDIRPGLTPPPMMEIPDYGDELARLQQLFWKRTDIRWQGEVTSGVPYAVSVDMPRMIRVPSLTLTGQSQTNFPSGSPSTEGLTANGFAAVKTANGTGNGNFIFTALANARL